MNTGIVLAGVALTFVIGLEAARADELKKGFEAPPDEAKPRVFWWWVNNLVNREGITRDLEQFKAKGIGGVALFNGRPGKKEYSMPEGPTFMSPEWRELVKHALREADRLGLEVHINLCSGWNGGGPWITPEAASKEYIQADMVLDGPQHYAGPLPTLPAKAVGYRDVVVQAFRMPAGRKIDATPKAIATAGGETKRFPAALVVDGDEQTWCVLGNTGATPEKPEWLLLEYPQPVSSDTIWISPRGGFGPREVEVQTSADGKEFTTMAKHRFQSKAAAETISLPKTESRFFRVLITSSFSDANTQIAEVALQAPPHRDRLKLLAIKSGRDAGSGNLRAQVEAPLAPPAHDPAVAPVDPATIIELTGNVKADGTLEWAVPEGRWIVLRTGYANTGRPVKFAAPGGSGMEMDALDPKGIDLHFKSMADVLMNDSEPLLGKTLKYVGMDSWEAGLPNWNTQFLDDFRKFRGYDARPYLPALGDHAVGSAELSDRFLHDFRKTIADCMATYHYGRLGELARARGVAISCEAAGPSYPQLLSMDGLRNLGLCEVPMGEFWQSKQWHENTQNFCGKQTAVAAHIYGRRWVAAEAFTSMGPHWEEGPAELKPAADIAFCEGINRFAYHTATCTRPEDGKPGYEYFAGTHQNPNVTWWEQAGAWNAYVGRCQWMLSSGLFVADVCYYNGDGAPNMVEAKHVDPSLGPGFDYDVCNADVLLTRMSVQDGRLVLPDGMSYRVLSLPDRRTMPVEVVKKLKELAEAGATIVGPRPESDPGLRNYPQCDEEVRKLAEEVWGGGRVLTNGSLREILAGKGVGPDFAFAGKDEAAWIDFIHRRDGETEIYFVANRLDRDEAARCTFRVSGKQPELWDPVSGKIREAGAFTQADGTTTVPLEFAPYGSMFVVFRQPIAADRQGKATGNALTFSEGVPLAGPWTVRFDPAWGGPESVRFDQLQDWTASAVEGIKFYSGTAVYACEFDLPAASVGAVHLDLGAVKNVASVTLNGEDLGVVWTRPFRINISRAAKPKGNRLEVRVANLWPNRLIGDAALPKEKRLTRTNVQKFTKDSPLLPSGLLGPVLVRFETGITAGPTP